MLFLTLSVTLLRNVDHMYFKWHYFSVSSHIFWEFICRLFNVVMVKLLLTWPPREIRFCLALLREVVVHSAEFCVEYSEKKSDRQRRVRRIWRHLRWWGKLKKGADFYSLITKNPSEFSLEEVEISAGQKITKSEIQFHGFLFSAQCVMCDTAYRLPMAASDCECWWTYWILWAE